MQFFPKKEIDRIFIRRILFFTEKKCRFHANRFEENFFDLIRLCLKLVIKYKYSKRRQNIVKKKETLFHKKNLLGMFEWYEWIKNINQSITSYSNNNSFMIKNGMSKKNLFYKKKRRKRKRPSSWYIHRTIFVSLFFRFFVFLFR